MVDYMCEGKRGQPGDFSAEKTDHLGKLRLFRGHSGEGELGVSLASSKELIKQYYCQ